MENLPSVYRRCKRCGQLRHQSRFFKDHFRCHDCRNARIRPHIHEDTLPPNSKCCLKCFEVKPHSEFYKSKESKDGWQPRCKNCMNRYRRKWRKTVNPEKRKAERRRRYLRYEQGNNRLPENRKYNRNWRLQKLFGISYEQFELLIEWQQHRCALCDEEFIYNTNRKPAVDHDHDTDEIRGILCKRCNQALGMLGDNIDGILRAMIYLLKPKPNFREITEEWITRSNST